MPDGIELVKKKRRGAKKVHVQCFDKYLASVMETYDARYKSTFAPAAGQQLTCNLAVHVHDHPVMASREASNVCDASDGVCEASNGAIDDSNGASDASNDSCDHSSGSKDGSSCSEVAGIAISYCTASADSTDASAESTDASLLTQLVPSLRACHSRHKGAGNLLEAITGLQLALQVCKWKSLFFYLSNPLCCQMMITNFIFVVSTPHVNYLFVN